MVTTTKQNTPWRGQEAANNLGLRGLGLVEKRGLKGLRLLDSYAQKVPSEALEPKT